MTKYYTEGEENSLLTEQNLCRTSRANICPDQLGGEKKKKRHRETEHTLAWDREDSFMTCRDGVQTPIIEEGGKEMVCVSQKV